MAVETHPEDFVAESAVEKKPIPAYLIKETIDGVNYYYKGFREVLNKTKTKADIMVDSGLQLFIKSWLMSLLFKNLDENRYYILGGEAGAHIDHRNNLSLDLTVFDNTVLTPDKITTKYIDVPPKIVIEIDVNVEVEMANENNTFDGFLLKKVKKLHQFGTEKIIWIFTKSKTVIVSTVNQKWDFLDWDNEVEIMDGISFNIAAYLQEKGIDVGE